MIRQDYILDLIEQAVRFLLQAMNLAQRGDHQAAWQETDRAAKQLVGLNLDLVERLPPRSVLDLLRDPGGALDEGRTQLSEGARRRTLFSAAVTLYAALSAETAGRLPVELVAELQKVSAEIDDSTLSSATRVELAILRARHASLQG